MEAIHQMKQQLIQRLERRSEPRTFADRQVIIIWEAVQRSIASATVLDWSTHGLRIRHNLPLHKGDVVTALTPDWEARVRVVWMMESDQGREAGLLFLELVRIR